MVIAFDASSKVFGSGTSATVSHTCTGSSRLLFVGIHINQGGSADTVSGVTYAGTALTLVAKVAGSATEEAYLWYLINPASGANNIVVSASTSSAIDVVGASYTGTLQSGVPDASVTGTGASPRTLTVTTVLDNCWSVGVFASDVGSAISAGTGTTNRTTTLNQLINMMDSNAVKTPPGSFSIQGTAASGNINGVAASFAPSLVAAAVVSNNQFGFFEV